MKPISELRQDIVTGEWVVVATGRARRPNALARGRTPERPQPKAGCPFERIESKAVLVYDRRGERFPARLPAGQAGPAGGRLTPLEASPDVTSGLPRPRRGPLTGLTPKDRRYLERHWWLEVVPNKYPAFRASKICPLPAAVGPHRWLEGVGFHEVVVTRDHARSLARMTSAEAATVIRAYRERYLALKDEACVEYISIFHNHGHDAGATLSHPHSQIIAIPVIPPDIGRSLVGSAAYYRKHRRCVHCAMIAFERRDGRRIVYENGDYIVFCPFVSRSAFEIRIFPKRHRPEFEALGDREILAAADALRIALAKLERGLADPAYNFFIHTAPTADGKRMSHYHWHIEIVPKTAVWAGFEIGTGIQISTTSPEVAGRYLRAIKV